MTLHPHPTMTMHLETARKIAASKPGAYPRETENAALDVLVAHGDDVDVRLANDFALRRCDADMVFAYREGLDRVHADWKRKDRWGTAVLIASALFVIVMLIVVGLAG